MNSKNKLKFSLALIIVILNIEILIGQNTGYYYKYDLKQFLRTKTKDNYLDRLHNAIRYPPILREVEIEGSSRFMVVLHGKDSMELFQIKSNYYCTNKKDKYNEQRSSYIIDSFVKNAMKNLKGELLETNNEKCITEFSILFDIIPYDEKKYSDFDLVIKAEKVKYKTVND